MWWLAQLSSAESAASAISPPMNSHHARVVRIFMTSARTSARTATREPAIPEAGT